VVSMCRCLRRCWGRQSWRPSLGAWRRCLPTRWQTLSSACSRRWALCFTHARCCMHYVPSRVTLHHLHWQCLWVGLQVLEAKLQRSSLQVSSDSVHACRHARLLTHAAATYRARRGGRRRRRTLRRCWRRCRRCRRAAPRAAPPPWPRCPACSRLARPSPSSSRPSGSSSRSGVRSRNRRLPHRPLLSTPAAMRRRLQPQGTAPVTAPGSRSAALWTKTARRAPPPALR